MGGEGGVGDRGQGGGGSGGKGKVAKEQIAKEKRKRKALDAKSAERRNAAPPSARKESPTFSNPWGLLAITSTSGTGPRTLSYPVAGGWQHGERRPASPPPHAMPILHPSAARRLHAGGPVAPHRIPSEVLRICACLPQVM
jgi:hypothetical protein